MDRPLKIAHVTECWQGGIGTSVKSQVRGLSARADIGEIHLIACQEKTNEELEKTFSDNPKIHIHYYHSSRNPAKAMDVHAQINEIVKGIKPDLLHLHSTFPGVYGRIKQFTLDGKRVPIVYCAHGWSFNQESVSGLELRNGVYGVVESVLNRNTDAIIHISQHEKETAEKRGIIGKRNIVISNAVRAPVLTDAHPLEVETEKLNIGFLGRLDKQKGVDVLDEALKQVTRKDYKLHVIGASERNKGYEDTYLQPSEHIKRYGWVYHRQIDDYLKDMDVLVVPSRWEGFGLVVPEAMRNGIPVIVSDAGALPELVTTQGEKQDGYMFHSGDAKGLAHLIDGLDKATLKRLGEQARHTYQERFTTEGFIDKLAECYYDVLSPAQGHTQAPKTGGYFAK